ncbi:phage antirepressor KilAC domain-containing protein [Lactococcus fujiensis]|uniref:Bro-N domain-containing protein n=1 Tax=Lactococcus fujiensis JCM 16395 TaxID=1291764 RepID=A0A2A5RKN0_9LACT|nr:phage antirepressor KilAC domain-containing protein [Lactococcus fujiensis]PCR99747.1 hypothetical protein RT41_GL001553 [Lactococcus fujiensis JCM 16395]
MTQLQTFKNELFNLSVKTDGENNLFNAEDVAKALGFTTVAKSGNVVVRWSRVNEYLSQRVGKIKKGSFISEPMVYKLAFKANNAVAEKFTDWLAIEVLPTIRKHGAYMTSEVIEKTLTSPDFIIQLAMQLKTEQEKTAMLSQQVAESRPKADYYDRILKSKSLVTISQIADDYGMTAQALNKKLFELQIQHKVGGQWLLYAKHKNHGYTFSDTTILPNYKKGGEKVVMNTKWTQKGRIFIYNVLKSEGILPTIEKNDAA